MSTVPRRAGLPLARPGRRHGWRTGWCCPGCGWPSWRDKDARQAGWCPRCERYSGLCAAGWGQITGLRPARQTLQPPDQQDWQFACQQPGQPGTVYAYQFPDGHVLQVLLCGHHARQVTAGAAPALAGLLRRL